MLCVIKSKIYRENLLSVTAFAEAIISHTGLGLEAMDKIQERYTNFKVYTPYHKAFLELYELRKLGYTDTDDFIALTQTKSKFSRKLDPNNQIQNTLYNFTMNPAWPRLRSEWEVSTEILKICEQFKISTRNLDYSTNRPPIQKNSGSSQGPNVEMEVDIKSLTKKCESCQANFRPFRHYHKKCKACFGGSKNSTKKSFIKKKFSHNIDELENSETPSQIEQYTSNNTEVSTLVSANGAACNSANLNSYHVRELKINPGIRPSVIFKDALFDSGSGPSLVLEKIVSDLKLADQILPLGPNVSIRQGDGSVMKGCTGTILLNSTLFDSSKTGAKPVKHRFYVYTELNHEFIIGRDYHAKAIDRYTIFTKSDIILFNPSARKFKKYTNLESNFIKQTIESTSTSSSSTPSPSTSSSTPSICHENSNILLNIPQVELDNKVFSTFAKDELLSELVSQNLEALLSQGGIFEDETAKIPNI